MAATRSTASKNKTKYVEEYKEIKTILVSQPKPERSPYYEIEKKHSITIDWRSFIHVEGVTEKEFRKNRVRPDEFTSIIFCSKNAIENFFRICEEMRVKMSPETKYFCVTEAIANYLQKFIVYRKRKVFAGNKKIEDLHAYFTKFKSTEKFLLPNSNLGNKDVASYLDKNKIEFTDVLMYRTLSSDLSDLENVFYDVLIFFSPQGIESLFENFPDFKQNNTRIAVWGQSTLQAVKDHGIHANIVAPTDEAPSMSMALELYLNKSNKKSQPVSV
jgi:uroporphyrinogen-III synthase